MFVCEGGNICHTVTVMLSKYCNYVSIFKKFPEMEPK